MNAEIKKVTEKSPAQKAGIKPHEKLVEINGKTVHDILDYMYYSTESKLCLKLEEPDGSFRTVNLKKDEYEDIGLEFENELMDKERSCSNRCVFCFIDQLPKGLRSTLYYKDDDTRLSFLTGNYVTLTNMSDEEIDRIISLKISPLNISVHTLNPELRVKMMNNKNAGKINDILKKFYDGRINIRCQIVLCRDLNDKDELIYTLNGLKKLYPCVSSVSVVPVGLTKYRDKLYDLKPFDKESALETLSIINKFAAECKKEFGIGLAYAADEFYMLADKKIPPLSHYDELEQLENGVGMTALLCHDFKKALRRFKSTERYAKYSIATGVLAEPVIKSLVDEMKKRWHNLDCSVYAIRNDFFGERVTVSGLVTGTDIIAQLKGKELGDRLLIPSSMLRYEGDMFLDNVTVEELSDKLKIKVCPVYPDGESLFKALTEDIQI